MENAARDEAEGRRRRNARAAAVLRQRMALRNGNTGYCHYGDGDGQLEDECDTDPVQRSDCGADTDEPEAVTHQVDDRDEKDGAERVVDDDNDCLESAAVHGERPRATLTDEDIRIALTLSSTIPVGVVHAAYQHTIRGRGNGVNLVRLAAWLVETVRSLERTQRCCSDRVNAAGREPRIVAQRGTVTPPREVVPGPMPIGEPLVLMLATSHFVTVVGTQLSSGGCCIQVIDSLERAMAGCLDGGNASGAALAGLLAALCPGAAEWISTPISGPGEYGYFKVKFTVARSTAQQPETGPDKNLCGAFAIANAHAIMSDGHLGNLSGAYQINGMRQHLIAYACGDPIPFPKVSIRHSKRVRRYK